MKIQLHALVARHPAARSGAAPALANLDLEIAAGERLAVIGPSGAGKTTLLQPHFGFIWREMITPVGQFTKPVL